MRKLRLQDIVLLLRDTELISGSRSVLLLHLCFQILTYTLSLSLLFFNYSSSLNNIILLGNQSVWVPNAPYFLAL